ncbi:hypothetical protein [Clostridium oryzae]|uniref:Uncharacterized protein n=1 Tax=Clostridium oryzae TaxID=1450648 RepID=A0A1V4IIC7_9CLOT|nr:hypothetical protein [Clostridium oryzae]OPJ59762.1 hypothetical protein CLORY_31070 [Clostridium oryzae]
MLIAEIFLVICLLLSVGTGIAVYLYLHPRKNSQKQKTTYSGKERNRKESRVKALFQIRDIYNGIIKTVGGGYRAVLSISSPDFELLTDEEQEGFENSLMQFSLSLNFPVQFFSTTMKVETKEPAVVLDNVIKGEDAAISIQLKEYAQKLKEKLHDMEREESYVRRSYCIIPVNGINDEKRALNELKNRMQTAASGLKRCNMHVQVLDSTKILQLLHDTLNKGSNIRIDELINGNYGGVLELYSQGIGGIVNVEPC